MVCALAVFAQLADTQELSTRGTVTRPKMHRIKRQIPPTTIGSLWENYNAFVRPVDEGGGGGNEKKGRDYQNVVRKPLITGDDETPILGGVFYFPELHCLIGIVGKIMKELETSLVFPSEKAGREYLVKWEKSANINRTAFHGTTNYTGI